MAQTRTQPSEALPPAALLALLQIVHADPGRVWETPWGRVPLAPQQRCLLDVGQGKLSGDLCTAAPGMFRVAQALAEAAAGPTVLPELPRRSPAPSWWAPQHGEGRAPRGAHPGGNALRAAVAVRGHSPRGEALPRQCCCSGTSVRPCCRSSRATPGPHCCPLAYQSRTEFSVSVSGWRR